MFDVRSSAGKAGFLPGADEALRIFRGADGGAQVHDCRGIICRAGVAGEGGGFFGNQGFDFFKGLCQVIQAADDADDIAVDDGFRPVKGPIPLRRRTSVRLSGKRPLNSLTMILAVVCSERARV